MRSALLIAIAALTTACTTETGNPAGDRSRFDVVREGINLDERVLTCATDPLSVGFETSQQCFDHAQTLFEGTQ